MSLNSSKISRIIAVIVLSIFLGYGYRVASSVPTNFPTGKTFIVDENESLRSVSYRLEKEGYINSALWFRAWISFLGGDKRLQLGGYVFDEPTSLNNLVKKFTSELPDLPLIHVTIPEGKTTHEVAVLVNSVLPTVEINKFEEEVARTNSAGKLFPSTYFLLPSMNEAKIVSRMTYTFEKKYIESFENNQLPKELKNETEVISLAAILEGEAKTEVDMKIVSGILLKRIKLGMPLQVDAAPETYKTKGVPKTPINNPGLVTINAVFHPTDTSYLYYLTGKDGAMHYAKTFEEHKLNIKKYLK